MKITLIQSPYDSGRYNVRMGRGPLHLVQSGALDWLRGAGYGAGHTSIRLPEGFATEVGSAVEIQHQVAAAAASARQEGRLPILLAGNCNEYSSQGGLNVDEVETPPTGCTQGYSPWGASLPR